MYYVFAILERSVAVIILKNRNLSVQGVQVL